MVHKDAVLQQTQQGIYGEHPLLSNTVLICEMITRYHHPTVLFVTFLIGSVFLLALLQFARWPIVALSEYPTLKIQLTPKSALTSEPKSPHSTAIILQNHLSQKDSSAEESKLQKAPIENQAITAQPDKAKPKENRPSKTEPASNAPPLKARLFDTLHYQDPHRALDQAPHQNLFNSHNKNSSNTTPSSGLLGGNSAKIQTHQAQNGDTIVTIDGRCYRVFDDEFSPTGRSWSLPRRCTGHKTESDHIAEGLRKAMQERFGNR